MIIPKVNLNGNKKDTLVDQALAIHNALNEAKILITESELTHGRNFQLNPPGDYDKSRAEREQHWKWLNDTAREYLTLAFDISQQ